MRISKTLGVMSISYCQNSNLSLVLYPTPSTSGEGRNLLFSLWLSEDLENFRKGITKKLTDEFDHRDLREVKSLSKLKTINLLELVCSMVELALKTEPILSEKGTFSIGLGDTFDEVILTVQGSKVILVEKLNCTLSTVSKSGKPIVRNLCLSLKQNSMNSSSQKEILLSLQSVILDTVSPDWWTSDDSKEHDAVAIKSMLKLASDKGNFNGPLTVALTHKLSQSSWSATST